MAKLKPGPFGLPTGRIGNTVFYVLNGVGVARSIGEQKNDPTDKQMANRTGFKKTNEVLKPLQKFIKYGFEHQAKGTVCNPFNLATSYNKHHALKGTYPNQSIDYAKLKLSSGLLPIAKDFEVIKSEGGLTIKWNPEHQWAGDQYDDLVMVALYHPADKDASLFLNAGKRDQGECFVAIQDENLLDSAIEAYLTFRSADGNSISDSVYLGNVNGSQCVKEKKEAVRKYIALKAHFDQVEANYLEKEALYLKSELKKKVFRSIEKEYNVLKEKLDNMPGKPG